MKNQPGTMKNHENLHGTMKNLPGTMKNQPGTVKPTSRAQLEKVIIFRDRQRDSSFYIEINREDSPRSIPYYEIYGQPLSSVKTDKNHKAQLNGVNKCCQSCHSKLESIDPLVMISTFKTHRCTKLLKGLPPPVNTMVSPSGIAHAIYAR